VRIDRRNRVSLAVLGVLLAVSGGLSAALGGGVFGTDRADRDVFDATITRWWNEGGWESFAVVTAIGVALFCLGVWMVLGQLLTDDGRSHTPTVTFPTKGNRGETTLRSSSLANSLQVDLERATEIAGAHVGLFGPYPSVEMRAVLTVVDDANLDDVSVRVEEALGRMESTAGVRPDPVQVTVRFKAVEAHRQLR
jgi:hypothetical protein